MSLFIVGMHRSGTSLLTALLAMAGANPGPSKALTGANEYNSKGFWELNRFRSVNEKLLHQQHCEWDCPLGFEPDRMRGSSSEIGAAARDVLESLGHCGCFVVKDPRLCLTFRFWRCLCPDALPIIPIRSPLEVAASLYRRNSIPIPIGIALWECYVLSAARETESAGPIFISHHELISRPVETLQNLVERIESRLAIQLEMPDKSMINKFVDPDLHHHVFSAEDQQRYLVQDQQDCWETVRTMSLGSLSSLELSLASRAALEGYEALGMQFSRALKIEKDSRNSHELSSRDG